MTVRPLEKVQENLNGYIGDLGSTGSLFDDGSYINYASDVTPDGEIFSVFLEGNFTAAVLRRIADILDPGVA